MACATLKRNFDWESSSMAQLPAKRRRCAPFAASPSTSPGHRVSSESNNSIFKTAKWTPERMSQEIWNKIKRLQRRRQLRLATGSAASCSSSSGSEGDTSPHRSSSKQKVHHQALFTYEQVLTICEHMLSGQEAALRAEYDAALSTKLAEQYEAFVRFNIDQVQRRPPTHACMPLGMDAEHHMHQDLVPSYLS